MLVETAEEEDAPANSDCFVTDSSFKKHFNSQNIFQLLIQHMNM